MKALVNHGLGKSIELHLEKFWARSVTIATHLVDTATTPMVLKLITSGKLQALKLITSHSMKL
jgi:alcohol dehydrogenase